MQTQLMGGPAVAAGAPHTHPMPPQALGLVLATMEGLLGRRSLHQLRPWLSPAAFLQLVSHVEAGTFGHSALGRLRMQMPTAQAVEASARISLGHRWLACTVRLDRAERWLCSDITVIGLTRHQPLRRW
ncbi:Rv3235 family protein [Tessaracoccus sp.]